EPENFKAIKNVKKDPMVTEELSVVDEIMADNVIDEIVADNVIDEILTQVNTKDSTTLVFAAPSTVVPFVSDSKPTHVFPMVDVQALTARALYKKKNNPREKLGNV
nr:hypothetical protein [Tanacetum cinerariifolium]